MNKKITDSAHRLRELMDELQISQSDLCSSTGLNKSVISLYVNGKRDPRQDNLALISETYRIDPAWLMGFDVPMRKETFNKDSAVVLADTFNDSLAFEISKVVSKLDDNKKETLLQYAKFLLSQ